MTDAWTWGQNIGLTDGARPHDQITRQEVITMLHRLHNFNNYVIPVTDEDLDILYRIAWAEAQGEDDKGVILIVNVIVNRINSSLFPHQNNVRDVVFAPGQFAPVTDGSFDRATLDQRIKDLVHKALRGTDLSHGTLFFNGKHIKNTSWAGQNRVHAFDHGKHSFYY